jgi:hypothetical protein
MRAASANVDRVSATFDPTGRVTAFRRAARALQTAHREATGSPVGQYLRRPNGAVFDEEWHASNPGANFLSDAIVAAVDVRVSQPARYEQLEQRRLRRHLLGSMPMCFNLFGELASDPGRLTRVGRSLFGLDLQGLEVRFEWSPQRRSREYTDDQTAFDVALVYRQGTGEYLVGIETKYHEWAEPEKTPSQARLERYRQLTVASGVFKPDWADRILGTSVQQIWRDHLLLLSLLQHPSRRWAGGAYVLVHPRENPSFADAATDYQQSLCREGDEPTFRVLTIEDVLAGGVLTPRTEGRFRERYLW